MCALLLLTDIFWKISSRVLHQWQLIVEFSRKAVVTLKVFCNSPYISIVLSVYVLHLNPGSFSAKTNYKVWISRCG